MLQRRRPTLATLTALHAAVSLRTRSSTVLQAALLCAGKVLGVVVALRVAEGDLRGATVFGVIAILAYGAARVVSNGARVNAECDLHRAVARALLESDVLDTSTSPLRTLYEPMYLGRVLLTDTTPDLAASALASLAAVPLLMTVLTPRALVVSGAAVAVVMGALLLVGRRSAALQRRVSDALEVVHDRVSFAVEGRLELVARGAEDAAMESLEVALERYRTVARRASLGAALLGRAPLVAGLGAVLVAVLVDTSYRDAVTSAALGQTLVLAACLPILLGLVLRSNELTRLATIAGPVLDVLDAPRRRELTMKGAALPDLPAALATRELTFAYGDRARPTLKGLSLDWPIAEALFVEGPNGAGKSTLLRLLLGLRAPQGGALTVGGVDLSELDVVSFRRHVAYLPQRPYLGEPQQSVRGAMHMIGQPSADAALREVLARVGLSGETRAGDILETAVGELSAGQRQRLALARLLLQDSAIYLLDEPDANLDRAGIALVGEIVRELVGRGRMVAVAAHTEELASLPGKRVTLR